MRLGGRIPRRGEDPKELREDGMKLEELSAYVREWMDREED